MDRIDQLLLKKDVTTAVGAPKTTVNDWIQDFQAFIPTVREGRSIYYKPEAVDVLLAIKRMREEGLDKTRIARELPSLGFAMDHDAMINKVEKARGHAEQANHARGRDAFLTVMQTMSIAMERMTELEREVQESKGRMVEQDRINRELTELIEKQAVALEQQEKYIEESLQVRDQKLMESLRLSQEAKREIVAVEETRQKEMDEIRQRQSKGFLARLFGR